MFVIILIVSILGVASVPDGVTSLNNLPVGCVGVNSASGITDAPINPPFVVLTFLTKVTGSNSKFGCQYLADNDGPVYTRTNWGDTWTSWSLVASDFPSFYKNYNSLQAFAGALESYNVPKKQVTLSVGDDVILDETDTSGNAFIAIYNNSYGIFFAGHICHGKQSIIVAERQENCSFTRGIDSDGNFVYYYDNQYKLHLKYRSSQGHSTLGLTYIRFRD